MKTICRGIAQQRKRRQPHKVKRAYFERDENISVLTSDAAPRVLEVKVESGVQIIRIELNS